MPDIHIQRSHSLGLPAARRVAQLWATQAEKKFGLSCSVSEGEASDTVSFQRPGLQGQVVVAADSIEVTAEVGLLLAAFASTIRGEIEKNIDALLAAASGPAPAD